MAKMIKHKMDTEAMTFPKTSMISIQSREVSQGKKGAKKNCC